MEDKKDYSGFYITMIMCLIIMNAFIVISSSIFKNELENKYELYYEDTSNCYRIQHFSSYENDLIWTYHGELYKCYTKEEAEYQIKELNKQK